jgi:nucleoside-diphosphate-sugar epimerase
MSILITGATGFIGSHVLTRLLESGESVHMLSRRVPLDACHPINQLVCAGDVKMFRGDVQDRTSIHRAMEACDTVFHVAAYAQNWARDSSVYSKVNVGGTVNVLDVARSLGVRRVVITSSEVTLGPSHGVPVDTTVRRALPALTAYEQSKIDAERAVQEFLDKGAEVVIVNPTRVFGPGLLNEGNSVTRMIALYLRGEWRLILADGEAVGNYAFVTDVAAGHLLAMKNGKPGRKYILGGENLSFNKFFEILAELSHCHRRLIHVPAAVALAFSAIEETRGRLTCHYPLITPGWVRTFLCDWACSCEVSRQELGYTITPFVHAVKETLEWLSTNSSRLPLAATD